MSKLPGNAGVSVLGDKSLDFYRDPVSFYRQRIEKHRSRVFLCRLLNRPTAFICSAQGMRELLCEKTNVFLKDPTDLMTNMYGDTVVTSNGEEACLLRLSLTSLFTGSCLESSSDYITSVCVRCLKDLSLSGQPECVYSIFKHLGTELVLGLFLNVRAEEQPGTVPGNHAALHPALAWPDLSSGEREGSSVVVGFLHRSGRQRQTDGHHQRQAGERHTGFRRLSRLFATARLQCCLSASPAVHLRSDPQSSGVAAHLLHAGARWKRTGGGTSASERRP
uniref:Uncharacterized protein n=1 Tax=Lates calcarifer TaxID=8187 RepID=A0A4W6BJL6_LATCA